LHDHFGQEIKKLIRKKAFEFQFFNLTHEKNISISNHLLVFKKCGTSKESNNPSKVIVSSHWYTTVMLKAPTEG